LLSRSEISNPDYDITKNMSIMKLKSIFINRNLSFTDTETQMDSTNKNDKLIGKAMCDEFTVLKSLGIGLTAKVKLAKDPKGKLVAIKRYK
jgi:hypothetical protein